MNTEWENCICSNLYRRVLFTAICFYSYCWEFCEPTHQGDLATKPSLDVWMTECMQSSVPYWSIAARENAFHKELLILNFWIALKLLPHPFGLTLLWRLFPFPHLDRFRNRPRAIISKEKFLFHPACDFSLLWALVFVKQGRGGFSRILYLGYVMCFLLIHRVPSGMVSARIIWQEATEELLSALFAVTRFHWNFLHLTAIQRFSWRAGWRPRLQGVFLPVNARSQGAAWRDSLRAQSFWVSSQLVLTKHRLVKGTKARDLCAPLSGPVNWAEWEHHLIGERGKQVSQAQHQLRAASLLAGNLGGAMKGTELIYVCGRRKT